MRKIQNHRILDFESEPTPFIRIRMPLGSILLAVKLLHDGIYAWWSVSDLTIPVLKLVDDSTPSTQWEVHEFKIMGSNETIPENFEFVCILDSIVELPDDKQGVMIYPVFKGPIKPM
jgi:hypothetical protein